MLKKVLAYPYFLFHRYVIKDQYKCALGKWFWDDGDNSKLPNYPLNKQSIVFDIGGYIGIFSEKINNKYHPELYIFEPVRNYYEILTKKFQNSKNVKIYNFGLSDNTESKAINIQGERSSTEIHEPENNQSENASFKDIYQFINENNISNISLMSINIEGGEYSLLRRLISKDLIKKIDNLQIQFHLIDKDSQKDRSEIIQQILKTHDVNFEYPFVWDSFRIKK